MAIPDKANTRAEKYLASMAGESVALPDKPNTRRERYLAKAAGQVVETPEPITREEMYLDAIAEGGGGGGDITLTTLNVSTNGTTNAPSGTAYKKVVASVSNSYAASDEGKVVSNGALVAQTSDTATSNGTVDTTLINSLKVNVPIPTPTLVPKTITENGTYAAEDDNADGYSEVTVGVPVVGAVGESTSAGQYMVIPKVEGYSNFIAWVSDVDASYLSTQGRALMAYRIAVFSSTAVLSMKCANTTYPVNSATGGVHSAGFVEETSAQIKLKFPNTNTGILPDGHTIKYLWF